MQFFKIQIALPFGWADLKTSEDDGATYTVESFRTLKAAQKEIDDIVAATDGDPSEYRAVNWLVPQDGDLYD